MFCRSPSPPPSRSGRTSSPPKSPQSPRRGGRSELTPKLLLEAEADRLVMVKQVRKQVYPLLPSALRLCSGACPCLSPALFDLVRVSQHLRTGWTNTVILPIPSDACNMILACNTPCQYAQAAQGRRPLSGGSVMQREAPGSKPGTAQSQHSNFSADGMQMVAAEYVLDFGYVIKGTQKVAALLLGIFISMSTCVYCCHTVHTARLSLGSAPCILDRSTCAQCATSAACSCLTKTFGNVVTRCANSKPSTQAVWR